MTSASNRFILMEPSPSIMVSIDLLRLIPYEMSRLRQAQQYVIYDDQSNERQVHSLSYDVVLSKNVLVNTEVMRFISVLSIWPQTPQNGSIGTPGTPPLLPLIFDILESILFN